MTDQISLRMAGLAKAKRRAENRLAALGPEVNRLAAQLGLIADAIAIEALQPKVLEGKLRHIANGLRATVEGQ